MPQAAQRVELQLASPQASPGPLRSPQRIVLAWSGWCNRRSEGEGEDRQALCSTSQGSANFQLSSPVAPAQRWGAA